MWNLTSMSVFINHSFYMGYSYSQCGTGMLQSPHLKPLISSPEQRYAILQYHMALLGGSDTIYKHSGKALATST